MSERFDAIVIGTGQAGPPLAGRLDREGLTTAVIERQRVGGTCVNYGCIPTKALVASARAAHVARHAADWGVTIGGPVDVDMKAVNERMRAIAGASSRGVRTWLEGLEHVELIFGHAQLTGPRSVRVGDRELEAERIFINVGGRAYVPDIPGLGEAPYLTSSGMLALDTLPEHLVVVGGSYIGLEFGQMFRRFGSRVTIVEKGPRLIAREDEDVSDEIARIFEAEGIELRLDAECIALEPAEGGVAVGVDCDHDDRAAVGSHVLLAVGRRPNTHDLGLEAAGVATDARGYIEVDDALRTDVPGIWALGDCNGRGAFTHTAYNDYEIVAADLFDDDPRRVSDRVPCYGLFVDPPLGRAGMTEAQARSSGRPVLVGKRPMAQVGRAKERGETDGFIKVLVDAGSRQLLGAAILGIEGDEVVHLLLDAMATGTTADAIARTMHIHPTVAELIPTVLQSLKPLDG